MQGVINIYGNSLVLWARYMHTCNMHTYNMHTYRVKSWKGDNSWVLLKSSQGFMRTTLDKLCSMESSKGDNSEFCSNLARDLRELLRTNFVLWNLEREITLLGNTDHALQGLLQSGHVLGRTQSGHTLWWSWWFILYYCMTRAKYGIVVNTLEIVRIMLYMLT